MTKLRVAFAGTPEFAVLPLDAILKSKHSVSMVFTQPDRPSGRGQNLVSSPVKKFALANQISVFQPPRLGERDAMMLKKEEVDLMVVASYGQIVPRSVLIAPRLGCINIHASLLPRWRGASPIVQSILSGDKETGVSLMKMDEGLDTGDVFFTRKTPVGEKTQGQLSSELSQLGADSVLEALDRIEFFLSKSKRQPLEGMTYAPKIKKQQALIDWNTSAEKVCCHVRAYNPAPMAFSFLEELRCRIISVSLCSEEMVDRPKQPGFVFDVSLHGMFVSCAQGAIVIDKIQLPGKPVFDVGLHLPMLANLFLGKCFEGC